ncbi:MAG: T9SS type A sorting domain-containing protein [Bacteroidales bacterium]|nr:T9SS type A sorting domain-containing protein [Bacteroidales bacterium]
MKKVFFFTWISCISLFLNAQEWVYTGKTLPLPLSNNARDAFGQSLDVSGDYAVIGAPGYNNNSGYVSLLHFTGESWEEIARLTPSDSLPESQFGNSVSISESVVVAGCYKDDDNGTHSGSAYVFVKPESGWTNMTETVKLLAADGDAFDHFGKSVSISGNCIAVGAINDDDVFENSGSVYIFEKPESGWPDITQSAKLHVADPATSAYLGSSVDIDGDYLVAGGCGDSTAGPVSGAAWVFRKPGGGWQDTLEIARLSASDPNNYDYFGCSVGILGNTIVIGASGDDESAYDGGALYVFEKSEGEWTSRNESAKLTVLEPDMGDALGYSVAVSDSYIAGGALYARPTVSAAGAAYLFQKPQTGWQDATETAELMAKVPQTGDQLGISVAITGDQVLAGANQRQDQGLNSGAVYCYRKPADEWADAFQTEKILPVPHINNVDEEYGSSMDVAGGYAVVGAPGYKQNMGCAYVLRNTGSAWEIEATLTTANPDRGSEFGTSVAMYEDMIVVGAPLYENTGAAFLYKMPSTGWKDTTESVLILSAASNDYDRFGGAVDIYGNMIAVGAYDDDDYGAGSGSVYLFEPGEKGWEDYTESYRLNPSGNEAGDLFGCALEACGNYLVVGAKGDKDNGENSGASYIFKRPEARWTAVQQVARLQAGTPAAGDYFGESVSIDSNLVVVGSSTYDGIGANTGAAFVFIKPEGEWADATQDVLIQSPDAALGELFGKSVSAAKDQILVGAPSEDDAGPQTGAAYLFMKPSGGWSSSAEYIKFLAGDNAEGDNFGKASALQERTVLLSAIKNDDLGYSTGSAYTWEKLYPVFLSSDPASQSELCGGSTAELTVTAQEQTGFQWQARPDQESSFSDLHEEIPYSGTRSNTLSILMSSDQNGWQFRCRAFNALYADTSLAATLSLETQEPLFASVLPEQNLQGDASNQASLPDYTDSIEVTDNCEGEIVVRQEPEAGTLLSGDDNILTLTAIDAAGNFSSTHFTVNILPYADKLENSIEESITLHPNPTRDRVLVKSSAGRFDQVTLLDLNGRVIRKYNPSEPALIIDLTDQAPGIYFLKVVQQSRPAYLKVVKE